MIFFVWNDTPISAQTSSEFSHHSIVFCLGLNVHHSLETIVMSTCDRRCQLNVCSGEGNDLEANLAMIFGVLDSVNGLLSILIAILFGYLQIRQLRQLHRRQPIVDEPAEEVPARQQLVEHSIEDTAHAA